MAAKKATSSFLIALNAEAGVPVEVMLLPAGATIPTADGRGPWRVPDAAKLVADSLQASGGRMPIDENHSTDLAAPKGGPSPARGWMTGLQARADGIWAPVDWNESGKQLLADRAYRNVSVVFEHRADGTITRIKRAALTNTPNLRGLVALNAEEDTMEELLKKLRALLGLKDDADSNAIYDAVHAINMAATSEKAKAAQGTALQSQLAKVAGLNEDADAATVLSAVTTLATDAKKVPGAEAITALQAELTTTTTALNALQKTVNTERATAFVDGAIKRGVVSVKPMRGHYIERYALNAESAAEVEKEINAMPVLGPSGARLDPPAKDKDGKVALNSEQLAVARALGQNPDDFAKTLATEAANEAAA